MARLDAMRVAAAVVAAGALAGCGGGGTTTVGGTVSGLPEGTAVTLQLNGGETLAVAANGSFRFDDRVSAGDSYRVDVVGQPAGATCVVTNGAGEVDDNASRVDNVLVECTQRRQSEGGTLPSGGARHP